MDYESFHSNYVLLKRKKRSNEVTIAQPRSKEYVYLDEGKG